MLTINPNQQVYAATKIGNVLYLGGMFTKMNGSNRQGVACINTLTNTLTDFNPSFNNIVYTICEGTNRILFGGGFNSVSYKGVTLTGCNGVCLYNTSDDSFEKLEISSVGGWSGVVFDSKFNSGVFYVSGNFWLSFTDMITSTLRSNITACFGIYDGDTVGLIDVGFRAPGEVYQTCNSIVLNSNSLYIPVLGNSACYDVSSMESITVLTDWAPYIYALPTKSFYADSKIWITFPNPTAYKETSVSSPVTYGNIITCSTADATVTEPALSSINAYPNSEIIFSPAASISDMWEDDNYIYILGSFLGIGTSASDSENTNGGIAKISKSSYVLSGEMHDLRYNFTDPFFGSSVLVRGSVGAKYIDGNNAYLFGDIPYVGGVLRNRFSPYVVNSDFSKKQYAASLLV